jgi:AcrR family transcriptional regulator
MAASRTRELRLAPRKAARQERAHLTVEAILEAAAQVFESHGYARATTNRIAERAGISIGSLYQYFPNKDAILVALAQRHLAEGMAVMWPQVQRLSGEESWEEVLPGIVEAMVQMHAVAPMLHRCLFEETRLPKAVRDELEALEDALIEITATAIAADPSIERAACAQPPSTGQAPFLRICRRQQAGRRSDTSSVDLPDEVVRRPPHL